MSLYPFQLSIVRLPWNLLSQNKAVCTCPVILLRKLYAFLYAARIFFTAPVMYSKISPRKNAKEPCRLLKSSLSMYRQDLRRMALYSLFQRAQKLVCIKAAVFKLAAVHHNLMIESKSCREVFHSPDRQFQVVRELGAELKNSAVTNCYLIFKHCAFSFKLLKFHVKHHVLLLKHRA